MPAKTVKDILDFNASVPDKFKVGIKIVSGAKLVAMFCSLETGNDLDDQSNPLRAEYYGAKWSYSWTEKYGEDRETKGHPMPRFAEPKNKPVMPWGTVSCKRNYKSFEYSCHNAWFLSVSEAAKGYGPLLYDCLLAVLGKSGIGLVTDRALVSPSAANVWANYLTTRPDVEKKPLDFTHSTPETTDDCFASHHDDPDWNSWTEDPKRTEKQSDEEYEKQKQKHELMRQAVTYAYFDNGITTLNDLKSAGLIVGDTDIYLTEYFKNLYRSLLF